MRAARFTRGEIEAFAQLVFLGTQGEDMTRRYSKDRADANKRRRAEKERLRNRAVTILLKCQHRQAGGRNSRSTCAHRPGPRAALEIGGSTEADPMQQRCRSNEAKAI